MKHLWEAKKDGWECVGCHQKVEYKFEFPEPPAGLEWGKKFIDTMPTSSTIINMPYWEIVAGDYRQYVYPKERPPVEDCEKLNSLEKLMYAINVFPRDYYIENLTLDTWKRLQVAIPELLSLALDADALLENGLQAKARQLDSLSKLNGPAPEGGHEH